MHKNKIVFVCNDSNTVINFRKELILFLKEKNFDISVICGDSYRKRDILALDVNFYDIGFSNRSINPIGLIKNMFSIRKIIKKINPNIVFSFQLKPIILIGLGFPFSKKFKRFCMVEGLGDPFQPKDFKGGMIRLFCSLFYKISFKKANHVFLLNQDDQNAFIKMHILKKHNYSIINGIGIDVEKYKPDFNLPKENRVLMLSRLLINKGIYEFCKIAESVHQTRPDIIFELCGMESQITKQDIQKFIDNGDIVYSGFVTNIKEKILSSKMLILPSYREGFPRTILEAMALGRPTIGNNTIGIRDAIIDGETGFLINNNDISVYKTKIVCLIDNDELLIKLSKCARNYCENSFSSKRINNEIYKIIKIS